MPVHEQHAAKPRTSAQEYEINSLLVAYSIEDSAILAVSTCHPPQLLTASAAQPKMQLWYLVCVKLATNIKGPFSSLDLCLWYNLEPHTSYHHEMNRPE